MTPIFLLLDLKKKNLALKFITNCWYKNYNNKMLPMGFVLIYYSVLVDGFMDICWEHKQQIQQIPCSMHFLYFDDILISIKLDFEKRIETFPIHNTFTGKFRLQSLRNCRRNKIPISNNEMVYNQMHFVCWMSMWIRFWSLNASIQTLENTM